MCMCLVIITPQLLCLFGPLFVAHCSLLRFTHAHTHAFRAKLSIRDACLDLMRVTGMLLKKGAAAGLTLYQIALIMCRYVYVYVQMRPYLLSLSVCCVSKWLSFNFLFLTTYTRPNTTRIHTHTNAYTHTAPTLIVMLRHH